MKPFDPERAQAVLNEYEAELAILRLLVVELIDQHPNRQKVLANFRTQAEGYSLSAPPGTDPEAIVEFRARLQMYLSMLAP